MAAKQDFTTDEWAKLLHSAMLASVAITAAEPSGLWGTLKEGFANASGLVQGKDSGVPLIAAIVSDVSTAEGRAIARDGLKSRISGAKPGEIVERCLTELREVGGILDAKAGADGAAVKNWLYKTAERVAAASTEGGFLGFGGQKVSEHERATLAQIAAALRI
jgi:hypothetical protein